MNNPKKCVAFMCKKHEDCERYTGPDQNGDWPPGYSVSLDEKDYDVFYPESPWLCFKVKTVAKAVAANDLMIKKIMVPSCNDCPYLEHEFHGKGNDHRRCGISGTWLNGSSGILQNCDLENG